MHLIADQQSQAMTPLTWVCLGAFVIGLFIAWRVLK